MWARRLQVMTSRVRAAVAAGNGVRRGTRSALSSRAPTPIWHSGLGNHNTTSLQLGSGGSTSMTASFSPLRWLSSGNGNGKKGDDNDEDEYIFVDEEERMLKEAEEEKQAKAASKKEEKKVEVEEEEKEKEKEEEEEDEEVSTVVDATVKVNKESKPRSSRPQSREANPEDGAIVSQGKDVPAYPQVLALPVYRRPLFPGVLYPITITDKKTSRALFSLKKRGMPYVGVFLRKEDAAIPLVSQDPLEASVSGRPAAPATGKGSSKGGPFGQKSPGKATPGTGPSIEGYGIAEGDLADEFNPIDSLDEIYHTGTFAQIWRIMKVPDGDDYKTQVVLLAHRRIFINDFVQKDPVCLVKVDHVFDADYTKQSKEEKDVTKAYTLEIINTIKDILKRNSVFKEQLQYFLQNADINNPSLLADYAAGLTSADSAELQDILNTFDVKERLSKSLLLLKKELEVSKLQEDINRKVEKGISENQKRFFLQEQLKSIKRELGVEKDDKDSLVQKFLDRLHGKEVPDEVQSVISEEVEKLGHLENHSSEFNITRNYLDWLTILPWGVHSEENFSIENAEAILNEEHYGMDDVKERILEFIAVGALLGKVAQGKILCLVGPPGVGKTSIGKSIANALSREFYRFSVGGMTDVAEIKGHRRTYVGAMPGKLVQCLKKTQYSNPVVLIDEVDKIGKGGYQGDPSSALLEVLDPEQNSSFTDHYLDVPVDLSQVLFVCTANVEHTIPGPLADRMEFIRLSGYVSQEKVEIVQRFLEPLARKRTGVDESHAHLHLDAIEALIRWYCREAGVRNLQQHVDRIYRKVALQIVKQRALNEIDGVVPPEADVDGPVGSNGAAVLEKVIIDESNLHEYVGKPRFTTDRIYEQTPLGVVMGLAWNSMGGATLYIESSIIHQDEKGGSVKVTGQLGDVMKESAQIALTIAKGEMRRRCADRAAQTFFETHHVHLHVPEGATPKDGPSAGITMVTSLLSLSLDKHVKPNLAMTGEVTLTGRVLPIGGVKEKTIAARRSGVTELVFPEANKRDWDELQEFIKEGLTVHFVEHYSQVFDIAFAEDGVVADADEYQHVIQDSIHIDSTSDSSKDKSFTI